METPPASADVHPLNNNNDHHQQQQQQCSCSAAADLALLRKEMERYKAMYERERDQFEEYQQYSKELESEMELELKQRDRKMTELETIRRRLVSELDSLKSRAEQQRRDQFQAEEQLKSRLTSAEQQSLELKQKLRTVEQANDDMERRERINAQQLVDLSERYDKCLERCALLETGMAGPDNSLMNGSADNGAERFDLSLTSSSIRDTAQQRAASRESSQLIENMMRKIEAVESHMFVNGNSNSPLVNGHQQSSRHNNGSNAGDHG